MNSKALFGFLALSSLAGAAHAQAQGLISITLGNAWVVNQDHNAASDSQFVFLTGSGNDFLNVNAFVDILRGSVNRAQANVQGIRDGATPLSATATAVVGAPGGYMVFFRTGAGTGTVTTSGRCTATSVLPAGQRINMSSTSTMTLTCGLYGFPGQPQSIATAQVVPPSCSGRICSVYNRKILTQGAQLPTSFSTNAFFYSLNGSATASCTLRVGESAFLNTDVLADLNAVLN